MGKGPTVDRTVCLTGLEKVEKGATRGKKPMVDKDV